MRRALLLSLLLHGGGLLALLQVQGGVAPVPAPVTVQLLAAAPPQPAAPAPARRRPAVAAAEAGGAAARARPSPVPAGRAAAAALRAADRPVPAESAPVAARSVAAPAAQPAAVLAAPAPGAVATAAEHGRPPPATVADRGVRVLAMPDPDYPPLSRERGEQGVVMLQLEVDASGRLDEVGMLHSSGYPRLDRAAQAGVRRWRFQPAIANGQPVAAQLKLPVRFTLDEN